MSLIRVDRYEMTEWLKRPERAEADLNTALAGFSSSADGGVASDKIALIVRIALESAQLASNAVSGICEISHRAIDDQHLTDDEIKESLDNFTNKVFSK
ncbi:hypothetical protein G7066_08030 [Leucobacter coleopterorum]|uniref:Uncharacterized protein n=1 Tax=Leucobacter coleopterorum TaxID=2714933 RepID=A0ABX6JW98_9MICO|nr:hypothetical protein [Leucobacter coleopterorum]QIM18582.1 hypothetical protein G7066_08030 [Leucobacter coleopterorum]